MSTSRESEEPLAATAVVEATIETASVDESLLDELCVAVRHECEKEPLPEATYRVQLNKNFTFRAAAAVASYLQRLGVSHLYASPYLRARAGSMHGYDIVDHTTFNPEIGSAEDFEGFVASLRDNGLRHILDVVPNHMWVGSDENPWWQDLLENGPSSPYARFFDVDWEPIKPDLKNKVLLPVLGDQFGSVLEDGLLQLRYEEGAFFVTYYERRFPIAPRSFIRILRERFDELGRQLGEEHPAFIEYQSIITALGHLPTREELDPEKIAERQREKEVVKRRLAKLCEDSGLVREFIDANVAHFNGRPGEPKSFDLLDELLQDQAYRLSFWRVAADEINYRRFFDVNELAAVCMERPEVFEKTHALVLRLLDDGLLEGLRIDHADGLYDPTGYLRQLQERRFLQRCRRRIAARNGETGADPAAIEAALLERFRNDNYFAASPYGLPLYVVVEKILLGSEHLPEDWPVHGTTGYEFLNQLNGLFVESENAEAFDQIYARFTHEKTSFDELVYECKRLIMKVAMSSELNVLGHRLDRLSERFRRSRDFTLHGLTYALREIASCFPIYRTYTTPEGMPDRDRRYVERAVSAAKRRNPATSHAVFDFIRDVLLSVGNEALTPDLRAERLQFVGRFQQFTGPTMAKAVEDTAFYVYNRLVSLNEVGGAPERFGEALAKFHYDNIVRRNQHPFGLLAASTHDTKRSEDVRARINVLSELPVEWKTCLQRWTRRNKRYKTEVEGRPAPSSNDEYLLYQTILGTWPLTPPRGSARKEYVERIQQYTCKAQREAKVRTSWIAPDEAYECATSDFIAAVLRDDPSNRFLEDFVRFAERIARQGLWNGLSQVLLKLTSPGVPDLYQGTELWDFSLVDPDNRRPIDYELRDRLLAELDERSVTPEGLATLLDELIDRADDGRVKLFVASRILRLRARRRRLFSSGEYTPLEIRGTSRDRICAFVRSAGENAAVCAAPIKTANLCGPEARPPLGNKVWTDTRIVVPEGLQGRTFENELTGERLTFADEVAVGELLRRLPIGLWCSPRTADGATK